ncbi:BgTH12-00166 [Blumeria graminis f. sp. triticale]|nr:BgTH12-00166 [Blumeria graminis f. sp. triticale]
MNTFSPYSMRRQAQREARSAESWNTWKRNIRNNSLNAPSRNDLEQQAVGGGKNRLRSVQTEPVFPTQPMAGQMSVREIIDIDISIQKDVDATEVDNFKSDEERARHIFGGNPEHPTNNVGATEDDKIAKKRPWYMGKDLKHEPFTFMNQMKAILFNSWINILLLAAPAGITCKLAGVNGIIVFVVNFTAIVPLASLLSFATEEISLHVGESVGGLLNASFGNAIEIIVSVIALEKDEFVIVQTSLIGSILSNLLLVMGMCFFCGGIRRTEQFFNQEVAQTAASLLALSIGSIIIPTCFDLFSKSRNSANIASLSRGTSVILLFVYAAYIFFQLHTHQNMFNIKSQKVALKPRKNTISKGAISKGIASAGAIGAGTGRPYFPDKPETDVLVKTDAFEAAADDPEEPQLHIAVAWLTLAVVTGIIGVCAESMVGGISAITATGTISVEFVGLVLLPIVGNAAEHATAVTVALKDKMDLAIAVAVGSSMQISLLVIPLVIVIGWIQGKEGMTLSFDGFQVAVLFVSVLLVNYLIGDGKSHWLEGMLLVCLYLIIAVCAWYYPINIQMAA